jgi:hypothetical protein
MPSKGDEGFLYLVPNDEKDKTVFKWGPFRIKRVVRSPDTPEHLTYTLPDCILCTLRRSAIRQRPSAMFLHMMRVRRLLA